MSYKAIFLIIIIIILGIFIFFKVQVNGDPNSNFNKTTRFNLGKNGVVRSILGLHNDGDARKEYLANSGPIVVEWFKAASQDLDEKVLSEFAEKIQEYTGRPTTVIKGGALSDGIVNISDLGSYNLKATTDNSGSTVVVFFVEDYKDRPESEISKTFRESGMVISMKAHRDFLQKYSYNINQYYLSSMLHEFGHQLGMDHNEEPNCIMRQNAGLEGKPLEFYGRTEVQDFCPFEKEQISQLKLKLQN